MKNAKKKTETKQEASGVAYHRAIISATMNRDSNLTKEEFFKKLGVEDMSKDELKVVMGICFNAIVELSRININIRTRLNDLVKFLMVGLDEEKVKQIEENTKEAINSRHKKKQYQKKMEELNYGN